MPHSLKSLIVRLATGGILLPTVVALLWIPGLDWAYCLFVGFLVAVGTHEFHFLARAKGVTAMSGPSVAASAITAVSAFWGNLPFVCLTFFLCAVALLALHAMRHNRSLTGMAATLLGLLYVGWCGAHFALLRTAIEDGAAWVTFLIAVVALTDTGAYVTGKTVGRHKLAPVISPNKTWEGAAGGLLWAAAGVIALYYLRAGLGWAIIPALSAGKLLAMTMGLSVTAQLGDLIESAMKRDAGVKDSGRLFPGHGGVLDRCDGFLVTAPLTYHIVALWLR